VRDRREKGVEEVEVEEEKKRTRGTREGNEEKEVEVQYFRNLLSRVVLPAHDVVVP